MVTWHLRHLILIDYSSTLYIARLNNENCTLQQNYLVIPYNSYNKAAIIFLDDISTYNSFTCKQTVRTEACSESLYPNREYIIFSPHKYINSFHLFYSFIKCWFGTKFPLCTYFFYIDLPESLPVAPTLICSIYITLPLSIQKKRSIWSKNLLLFTPNSPRSLTLAFSPSSDLHWFCSTSSRVMRGHCPGTFKE